MFETVETRLYKADDPLVLSGDFELDEGVLVPMTPSSTDHAILCAEIAAHLLDFVKRADLGRVLGNDPGFVLATDPDTLRGPDVAFVSRDRLAGRPRKGFWKTFPDLAVEVMSPNDSVQQAFTKVGQYLGAGCPLVWVVNPEKRQAVVYRADGSVTVLSSGQALDGEQVLPGFSLPLDTLFAALDD